MSQPLSARSKPRGLRWLDAGLVLLLVALAVAVIVNAVRSDGAPAALQPGPQRTDATLPNTVETEPEEVDGSLPDLLTLPGELREEGGILWWSDEDCLAGSVELAGGSVALLPEQHCRLWPAPDGAHAVAVAANRADGLEGRGLVLFDGREGPGSVVRHPSGFLSSELAWAPNGLSFSTCFVTGKGSVIDIRPLEGAGLSGEGLCFPAWAKRGLAAVRLDPLSVEFAGDKVLEPNKVRELLPSLPEGARPEVSALAVGPGDRLAVALVVASDEGPVDSPGVLAVLLPGGAVESVFELPPNRWVQAIRFAPDGSAIWWADAGGDETAVFALRGERVGVLPPTRWLTWSPSGRYVALAGNQGIEIRTWPQGVPVATLPVAATDLSWTRAP